LRALLDEIPDRFRKKFRGFGDMTVEDVVVATGLSPDAAARARLREFSAPGLWSGTGEEKEVFLARLGACGIRATEGGRFLTLSFGASKADRMSDILAGYGNPGSIALGDAPNDAEMIEAADHGVIVRNPNHPPLPPLPGEAAGRIIRTEKPGPAGWSEAVLRLLSDLNVT